MHRPFTVSVECPDCLGVMVENSGRMRDATFTGSYACTKCGSQATVKIELNKPAIDALAEKPDDERRGPN